MFRLPTQNMAGLCAITDKAVNFLRAEKGWIDHHEFLPAKFVMARFIDALAVPDDLTACSRESLFHEFPYAVCFTRGKHVITGPLLLQHHPGTAHIIFCMPPITPRIEIPQLQGFFTPHTEFANRARDFTRDKL